MVGNVTNRPHSCDLHGKLTRHLAQSGRYQGIYLMDENLYYASGPGTPCYNGSISSMTDCLLSPGTAGQNYSSYTADGLKLWTVHRSAAGTIPADVLSDPDKPKPTPEIGSTPSLNSRLSDNLILNVDLKKLHFKLEFTFSK